MLTDIERQIDARKLTDIKTPPTCAQYDLFTKRLHIVFRTGITETLLGYVGGPVLNLYTCSFKAVGGPFIQY